MNPTDSHIGHVTSTVRCLLALGLTGMAPAAAETSMSNGSSDFLAAGFAAGALVAGGGVGLEGAAGAAADFCPALAAAGESFGGALAAVPGFIEDPQNGHSAASSSSTDCPQAGHVGRSIGGPTPVENLQGFEARLDEL